MTWGVAPACRRSDETVHHYLTQCPAYSNQREQMECELKQGARELKILLGRPNTMAALFWYINETGRFRKTFGDVRLPGEG